MDFLGEISSEIGLLVVMGFSNQKVYYYGIIFYLGEWGAKGYDLSDETYLTR